MHAELYHLVYNTNQIFSEASVLTENTAGY